MLEEDFLEPPLSGLPGGRQSWEFSPVGQLPDQEMKHWEKSGRSLMNRFNMITGHKILMSFPSVLSELVGPN